MSPPLPGQPGLIADMRAWSRGRWWSWRALLLVWLAWTGWQYLRHPAYASVFQGIDFGVHELGHLVFGFGGEWIGIAGGSLAQLLLPLAAGALFWSQRDYFGAAVSLSWEAFSLFELSRYVADARAQELDLVSFSETAIHDWNYLLSSVGLLRQDVAISHGMRILALLLLAGSLWWGAWMCREMKAAGGSRER